MASSRSALGTLSKLNFLVNRHGATLTRNKSRLNCNTCFLLHSPNYYPVSLLTPASNFHTSRVITSSKSYEHDGKTTVSILNNEENAPLMINSYQQTGFKLNNGMTVIGPMAIFPRTVLAWDVGGASEITPQSLALFTILEPKPDVLVIGLGDYGEKLPLETVQFLKQKKINMEILSTEHACTTFNFLSAEGRCAAAVMIPPRTVQWTAQDLANSKYKQKKLYEDDGDDGWSIFDEEPTKKKK